VAAAPRISFPLKEIDFGKAVQGEAIVRAFKFRNSGTSPLEVRRVKPSCGCTAALASKQVVAPGEEGAIEVRFETVDRAGFQNVDVHVFHNDAQEQDLGPESGGHVSVLRLRGEVTQLVSAMPMSLYFETFQRGKEVEKRVNVLPTDRSEIRALGVTSPHPWLRARVEPWTRGGRTGFEVIATVAADAPIGKIDAPILVATDHPRQPTVRIPAYGGIHGAVVSFPERLELFPDGGDGKPPTIFLMRAAEGTGLSIVAVEAPPEVKAEVLEVIPGRRAEVTVTLREGARPGLFAGVVRVFLRDAEQPVFEIPVVGRVPARVTVDPPAVWLEGPQGVTLTVRGARVLSVEVKQGADVLAPTQSPIHSPGKAPPVTVEAVEAKEGLPARILVRGASTGPAGPFRAILVIRTDAPGEETIEVPIHGIAAPPQ